MENLKNDPVSGYGSRLDQHVLAGVDRIARAQNSDKEIDLVPYLLEADERGLDWSHLAKALEIRLLGAGLDPAWIELILRRIEAWTKKVEHEVYICWSSSKPTNEEIVKIRNLFPEFGAKSLIECRALLGAEQRHRVGCFGSALLAEVMRRKIESTGIKASILKMEK